MSRKKSDLEKACTKMHAEIKRVAPGVHEAMTMAFDRTPLNQETLLRLGTIIADKQVGAMLGDQDDMKNAQAILAGIVVTLLEVLPQKQFRSVMVQWEIDTIKLSELLELAGYDLNDPLVQKDIQI